MRCSTGKAEHRTDGPFASRDVRPKEKVVKMSPHDFVGDLLLRAGLVDAAGLARGLEVQSEKATTLGQASFGPSSAKCWSAGGISQMKADRL